MVRACTPKCRVSTRRRGRPPAMEHYFENHPLFGGVHLPIQKNPKSWRIISGNSEKRKGVPHVDLAKTSSPKLSSQNCNRVIENCTPLLLKGDKKIDGLFSTCPESIRFTSNDRDDLTYIFGTTLEQ
jgi:hypothetical protein